MTKHVAAPIPEVEGIDLAYRPRSYFDSLPLETRVLARITGHRRREFVRAQLAAGNDYPDELAQSTLSEEVRSAIGRIDPAFMGGEYLPPLSEHETEIARISLESTTADQISVRASRLKDRIAYRIVDEYTENAGYYDCRPRTSLEPLTLRELVAMLDGACKCGGAVFSPIVRNVECGCDPEQYEGFVVVTSEFYPQLDEYYEARFATYFASRGEVGGAG